MMKASKAIFLFNFIKGGNPHFYPCITHVEPEVVSATHPLAGTRAERRRRTILNHKQEVKKVKEWSRHNFYNYTDGGPK